MKVALGGLGPDATFLFEYVVNADGASGTGAIDGVQVLELVDGVTLWVASCAP